MSSQQHSMPSWLSILQRLSSHPGKLALAQLHLHPEMNKVLGEEEIAWQTNRSGRFTEALVGQLWKLWNGAVNTKNPTVRP